MEGILSVIWYGVWFFAGAAIFSFLNVVVYRVPRKLSFVVGRSFCPSCRHPLKPLDLIPVLSWIGLGGKCRYCKARISVRYLGMELLGGALMIFCAHRYLLFSPELAPENWAKAVIAFAFLSLLVAVSLVDWDTMEIPNGFVLAMAAVALLSAWAFPQIGWLERGIGAICVSIPMLILSLVICGAFGGGDIKLMAACGLFLGWKLNLLAFFFAVLLGGGYGIYLLAWKKKSGKEHFPFGPFLCAGMAAAWFYGPQILEWYLGFFFW